MSPHDDWLICEACEEEVMVEEASTCASGCDFCPECWSSLTHERETEH